MAKIYGPLKNAQIENLTADPSSVGLSPGRYWHRTDTSPVDVRYYDGSAVCTFAELAKTQTLTNKTIDSASNTLSNILNASIGSAAAIARSKLAAGTASHVIINAGDGTFSSEATLAIARGGTAAATAIAGFNALSPLTTKGDVLGYSSSSAQRLGVGADGTVLTADTASTNGFKWSTPASAPDAPDDLTNFSLSCSVAASALTIALKDKAGSDPSGGSAVKVAFRDVTVATGDYVVRSITSALSIVVASTKTLGLASGSLNEYVYVYLLDNAGTPELAVVGGGQALDQGSVQTSTAVASGTSRYTLYSTSARTSKAIRLIARLKFSLATAGTWDEVPDEISLMPFAGIYSLNSSVVADTGNGHGNVIGTKVRRFTNFTTVGGAVTAADAASPGTTFTINEEGLYAVNYNDFDSAGSRPCGITLNSSQLTTSISSQTVANRLCMAQGIGANAVVAMATTFRGKPGDVIRSQTGGTMDGATDQVQFRIIKIGP